MAKREFKTREQWLVAATDKLKPTFQNAAWPIPEKVRVSCGWPKGSRGGKKTVGQHWATSASEGKFHEIFVSPAIADPFEVIDILTHELVHAVVPEGCGHKGDFVRCSQAIGLDKGKPTSASAGVELGVKLHKFCDQLGPYPHDRLNAGGGKKKEGTRLLKLECPDCGLVARVSRKVIDMGGLRCGICQDEDGVHRILIEDV